jgi:hypothetical protein
MATNAWFTFPAHDLMELAEYDTDTLETMLGEYIARTPFSETPTLRGSDRYALRVDIPESAASAQADVTTAVDELGLYLELYAQNNDKDLSADRVAGALVFGENTSGATAFATAKRNRRNLHSWNAELDEGHDETDVRKFVQEKAGFDPYFIV